MQHGAYKEHKEASAKRNVIYQVLIIRLCITSTKFVTNESNEKPYTMTETLFATNMKVS